MLELEDAVARILAALPPPQTERVLLDQAHGRILAGNVVAGIDLPPFDNSSMDGYAVRSADVATAGAASPASLRLQGRVAAGESFDGELAAGHCIRLFTGSPLPRGADAVVMQEDTRVDTGRRDEIQVLEPVKPWENARFRGEDVKQGATLTHPGDLLTPGRLSLLAACGTTAVEVARRPIIGLLATGSELMEPGAPLAPGHIYESNRLTLASLITLSGAVPQAYPIVADTPDRTVAALQEALAASDLVVTCGGVSVGEMDFVKSAFEQLGGSLEFWKVSVKPGRPFVFGRCREKFLFGLPGNPVSAFVTFLLLVRPALLRLQGIRDTTLPSHPGVLSEPLANPGGRRHFVRVILNASGAVRSAGTQASHLLASLAAANGLVDVPAGSTLPAGTQVRVLCWS